MTATFFNVTGEGPPDAKVILVGEAPGAVESVRLRPFVGKAGQLLRQELLGPIIWYKIFITNILACRPPKNRDPSNEEAEACMVRLQELFTILQPKQIIAVGRVAESWLSSRVLSIPLMFVYHPAFLLRSGVNVETLKAKPNPKHWSNFPKIHQALLQYEQLRKLILEL